MLKLRVPISANTITHLRIYQDTLSTWYWDAYPQQKFNLTTSRVVNKKNVKLSISVDLCRQDSKFQMERPCLKFQILFVL